MDMRVNIAGVEWKNPVTVASGTFGSGEEFSEFVDLNKLGAVTTKGVANVPWPGNPTPRVAEVYGGMMNAIGLQNPGIDLFCKRDIPYLKKVSESVKSEAIWHVYWHDKKAEDMLKNAFDEVGIALEYRDFKSDTKFWD